MPWQIELRRTFLGGGVVKYIGAVLRYALVGCAVIFVLSRDWGYLGTVAAVIALTYLIMAWPYRENREHIRSWFKPKKR